MVAKARRGTPLLGAAALRSRDGDTPRRRTCVRCARDGAVERVHVIPAERVRPLRACGTALVPMLVVAKHPRSSPSTESSSAYASRTLCASLDPSLPLSCGAGWRLPLHPRDLRQVDLAEPFTMASSAPASSLAAPPFRSSSLTSAGIFARELCAQILPVHGSPTTTSAVSPCSTRAPDSHRVRLDKDPETGRPVRGWLLHDSQSPVHSSSAEHHLDTTLSIHSNHRQILVFSRQR